MSSDMRLSQHVCENMTVKEIRKTPQYKGLTPLGVRNASGTYRYGHKSTMKKAELCKVLANPTLYHTQNAKLKEAKKSYGARKRNSRKGECNVRARKVPCEGDVYRFRGVTTTGQACCFKRRMSQKTIDKRLKNAEKAKEDKRNYDASLKKSKKSPKKASKKASKSRAQPKKKRGRPKKVVSPKPKKKRGRPKKSST